MKVRNKRLMGSNLGLPFFFLVFFKIPKLSGTPLEPLEQFFQVLELEYGGIRGVQIQKIQDVQKDKNATPYTKWAWFPKENNDVFME
jgi:hypothetical protein